MKQEEVKAVIKERIEGIIRLGDCVADGFDIETIEKFKSEVKMLRAFMGFVRTHKGERGMRMGEKCRFIYQVAGAMLEAQIEYSELKNKGYGDTDVAQQWATAYDRAKAEWSKHYSAIHFQKLERQLVEYNYSGIPGEFMDNFFKTHMKRGTLQKHEE